LRDFEKGQQKGQQFFSDGAIEKDRLDETNNPQASTIHRLEGPPARSASDISHLPFDGSLGA
jgi:hypothetical protein